MQVHKLDGNFRDITPRDEVRLIFGVTKDIWIDLTDEDVDEETETSKDQ